MTTEYTLSYLRGDDPAHYVALVGLIALGGDDLTLHFDGLTPVVTSACGATARDLGVKLAKDLRDQTEKVPGHALTRIGMKSSTAPLALFDDQVDEEWAGPAPVEWSTLVGFSSPDIASPKSHTLFFGSGLVHMGTVLANYWGSKAKADEAEALLARDLEEILNGEPAASVRQRAILRFTPTGHDSKQKYGGEEGFVDVALEALSIRVFDTLSPIEERAFVSGHKTPRPVFRWFLNQSPASAQTLAAMHRLDRRPSGFRSFQAKIRTVQKYGRFGPTTPIPIPIDRTRP